MNSNSKENISEGEMLREFPVIREDVDIIARRQSVETTNLALGSIADCNSIFGHLPESTLIVPQPDPLI